MMDFEFQNTTKVIFGKGKIANLAKHIPKSHAIMFLQGQGSIKKNKVYETVKTALKDQKMLEFPGVQPNPTYEHAMQAIDFMKKNNLDYILAVGGGSVVDEAKFIACGLYFTEGDPWKILSEKAIPKKGAPIGVVLTIPATGNITHFIILKGSESNGYSVVSRLSTQDKLFFESPYSYPQFCILDPEVTQTLPPKQISNGIVDGFTHVMEQYCTQKTNSLIQERFSEGILHAFVEDGPKTLREPTNYEQRANFVYACTLALNGLIGAGVPQDWATHVIGHEITALYGLDHGQTLAVVLPAMLRQKKESKREKLIQFGERIWNIKEGCEADKIEKAISTTQNFFESLGVKTRLRDQNIPKTASKEIADKLLKRMQFISLGEKGDVEYDDVIKILDMAY